MSREPMRSTAAMAATDFPMAVPLSHRGATAESREITLTSPALTLQHTLAEARYVLKVPTRPGVVLCDQCGRFLSARGPTGYLNDEPICDVCLLEGESQLGMLIALASIARIYATFDREDGATCEVAAAQLLAFARIYDRFAQRFGPARELNFEIGFFGGEITPEDR